MRIEDFTKIIIACVTTALIALLSFIAGRWAVAEGVSIGKCQAVVEAKP